MPFVVRATSRLFVKRDRRRRVEGDAISYQLGATLIEPEIACETPCEICAFHLEATGPGEAFVERDVMQQRAHRDDFRIVFYALKLAEPHGEEPGADNVIEQVGSHFCRAYAIALSTIGLAGTSIAASNRFSIAATPIDILRSSFREPRPSLRAYHEGVGTAGEPCVACSSTHANA